MFKLLVLLFMLFPTLVFAKDDIVTNDELKIEKMYVNIFYKGKDIKIRKNIETKTIYGNSKDLYFVQFRIPNTYELYNIEKGLKKYSSKESELYIETKSEYNILDDEEIIIELGTFKGLFQEKENVEFGYVLSFDENIGTNTSFPITHSDYDISYLKFKIHLNKEDIDKKIKFSFNNLDFKENLPKLKVEKNKEDLYIVGEYTGEIPAGKTFYFIIEDKSTDNSSFSKYIILIILTLVIILLLRILMLTKRRKNV